MPRPAKSKSVFTFLCFLRLLGRNKSHFGSVFIETILFLNQTGSLGESEGEILADSNYIEYFVPELKGVICKSKVLDINK